MPIDYLIVVMRCAMLPCLMKNARILAFGSLASMPIYLRSHVMQKTMPMCKIIMHCEIRVSLNISAVNDIAACTCAGCDSTIQLCGEWLGFVTAGLA